MAALGSPVPEKNSSRKLAEQARSHTPRYRIGMRVYEGGFPRRTLRDCPKRMCWLVFRYSSTHEKALPNRPLRCRVGCIEPHLPTPRAAGLEAERRLTDLLESVSIHS